MLISILERKPINKKEYRKENYFMAIIQRRVDWSNPEVGQIIQIVF